MSELVLLIGIFGVAAIMWGANSGCAKALRDAEKRKAERTRP